MKSINLNSIFIILGVAGFILIVVMLQIIQPSYNYSHQLMSELVYGKNGSLMIVAFFSLSIAVFSTQQKMALTENSLSVRILLIIAVLSFVGAGIYDLEKDPFLHIAFIAIAFISIIISMLLTPRLIPQFRHTSPTTICWTLATCTTISAGLGGSFIPLGIAQRLAAGFMIIWFLWLSVFPMCSNDKNNFLCRKSYSK